MVRKIIGLLGFILAIILSIQYSDEGAKIIAPIFSEEYYLSEIVSGVLIFILVVLITAVIKRVVHPLDKVNKFLNQLTGGITGAIQIVFFISGFLLFLNIFKIPSDEDRNESFLYLKTYNIIPSSIELILGAESDAMKFFQDFIQSKDEFIQATEQNEPDTE